MTETSGEIGRPTIYPGDRTVQISVTVPESLVLRLTAVSRQMGRSRSALVTQAVKRFLDVVDLVDDADGGID